MSASSRSTIFSLRSKKSKDSGELQTHAGPAYDDLPMSPRPPISVPTIIPPSQFNGRTTTTDSPQMRNGEYLDGGDEASDGYSVKSEPRQGNGYVGGRGGSISSASLGGGGGVSGPRPLPPRSGSAEKMADAAKYNPLGQYYYESPNVLPHSPLFLAVRVGVHGC